MEDFAFGCAEDLEQIRLAVVSGRLKNSKSPKDLDDIDIALIDPNRIVDSVGAFTTIEYYGAFNDERAAFFNLLANHPAGRLRAKPPSPKTLRAIRCLRSQRTLHAM